MIAYRVEEGALVISGKAPVRFPQGVRQVESFDEVLVVRLEWADNTRNVYAVDRDGKMIWQIDDLPDNPRGAIYMGIGRVDDRIVRAVSSMGVSFDLVARTGKVVRTLLTK